MTDGKNLISEMAAHAMLEAAQRQAVEIVALPIDARKERYTLISKTFKEAAIEMRKPVLQAEEAATKMVEWTRSTVMIIEAGESAAAERD